MSAQFLFFNASSHNLSKLVVQTESNTTTTQYTISVLSLGSKVLFGIIIVLGIGIGTFGNVLVAIVVYFNIHMRTVMYVFIINLSIADFMITAIFMPTLLGFYITTYPVWPYSPVVCKLVGYLVHMSALASALSLLAISYHRYFGIVHSLKRDGITLRTAKLISVFIWFVSGSCTLPSVLMHETPEEVIDGVLVKDCKEVWPSKAMGDAYFLFRISCYFFFTLQICVLYTRISCFLRGERIPGERNAYMDEIQSKRRRKVTQVLFIAASAYVTCWIPYMLNKLLIVVWPDYNPNIVFAVIGYFMGMLNSSINPYIYFLGHQYRTAVLKLLRRKPKIARKFTASQNQLDVPNCRMDCGIELIGYNKTPQDPRRLSKLTMEVSLDGEKEWPVPVRWASADSLQVVK